jgi:hypothetical protein
MALGDAGNGKAEESEKREDGDAESGAAEGRLHGNSFGKTFISGQTINNPG